MASNPQGPDTENVAANVPKWMADEITRRAKALGISKSNYIRRILIEWFDQNRTVNLVETIDHEDGSYTTMIKKYTPTIDNSLLVAEDTPEPPKSTAKNPSGPPSQSVGRRA